jgi:hypothetical protein
LSGLLKLLIGDSAPVAVKTAPSAAITGNSAPIKPTNNLNAPGQSALLPPPKFYPGRTTPAVDDDK